jgi:hypothetical protein
VAREALRTWLEHREMFVPPNVIYTSEAVDAEHEGRPDVVASVGGDRHLIIEGKF